MAGESNGYFFGFELLSKLVDDQLNKKEDVIVLLAHWYLVKNDFKCIGLGDSKTFDAATDLGSELLPAEWNQRPNYSLRYVKEGRLYILIAVKSDADLMINFLRVDNNGVSNITFPIETTVGSLHGSLNTRIPTYKTVVAGIRDDLVEPVCTGVGRDNTTQTVERGDTTRRIPDYQIPDPLRVGPPSRPDYEPWNPNNPGNIGRADLDPFSRGGGMIFDPFSTRRVLPPTLDPRGPRDIGIPGRLPRGSVPPGARFDPFGPPDVNFPRRPRGDPDDDRSPPPGYDDMFM